MKILKKRKKSATIKLDFETSDKFIFDFDELKLSKKVIKRTLEYLDLYNEFSVGVQIVSKGKIKSINKTNRNINKVTDVLSFPNISYNKKCCLNKLFTDRNKGFDYYDYSTKTFFLGDIVICYDKVLSQAKLYGHSVKREFAFLIVHSMLHLLGYDHMNIKDENKMFKLQDEILSDLNIIK